MSVLGLDIGGANIKAADQAGRTLALPFPIWKTPDQLGAKVQSILSHFPATQRLAVTMTAELADCFTTKAEGVQSILQQLRTLTAGSSQADLPIDVWSTSGGFVSVDAANKNSQQVAAANWHALATWVGRNALKESNGNSLLVDIGTTTTDIIPIRSGTPATIGLTDTTRLENGELCYSGIKRTPLCAIAHSVPFRDRYCPLAAELFATTLDLYLLSGDLPEDESDCETANGKPATKAAAHDRLARMLCADRDEVSFEEAVQMARFLADVQRQRLAGALERVLQRQTEPCRNVVVSGSGAFLARRLIRENQRLRDVNVISLDELMSPGIAEAACAYALAQLSKSPSE